MINMFGTDGIRGEYGTFLTCGVAYQLGTSLADLCAEGGIIVVGRDTRLSGGALLNAFISGVEDNGGVAVNIGILPTNAVAHFTRKLGADYGVMISASHNPPTDNGLKVFDKYGVKLCEKKQQEVSSVMEKLTVNYNEEVVRARAPFENIGETYVRDIYRKIPVDLDGIKLSLDCCYGASFEVARKLFALTKADLTVYCGFNDGSQINVSSGATHPEYLIEKLAQNNSQLGFAFDGDADRLSVFEKGKQVDNTAVFYCLIKYYTEHNMLSRGAVVGTVLTNSGLEKAIAKLGLTLMRSAVGDEKIFQLMTAKGVNLGGEESGHYLLSDYATSSDALINALMVSQIYKEKGSLVEYAKELRLLPVHTRNVKIAPEQVQILKEKDAFAQISENFSAGNPQLRLVLRPSGTEPVVRIFVEGDAENPDKMLDDVTNILNGYC